ncbi:hypothetical protein P4C99_00750 [Pontiellaceae bacterium B1224]|nr:hypothetical protein [Pontiellaceae bacterium B1224]
MKSRVYLTKTVVCMTLLMAGVNAEAIVTWKGGGADQNFTTAENWSEGAVPVVEDIIEISGPYTVTIDNDVRFDRLSLNGKAVLDIKAGNVSSSKSGAHLTDSYGGGSAATVNQYGGMFNIGHRLHLGNGAGGAGVYNLFDGELIVSRGGRSSLNPGVGNASLEIGDARGSGALNISGGRMITRGGLYVGPQGMFSVLGAGASEIGIGSDKNCDGHWIQQGGGILKVGIDDSPQGVTKILVDYVDGTGGGGDVVFEAGALLDVSFLGKFKRGKFVVMEWEGTVKDLGLKFAPSVNTSEWDFYIDEEKKCLVVESEMKKPLGLLISMN